MDEGTRCEAAEALGAVGATKAVGPLLQLTVITDGEADPCATEAITALGEIGDDQAVDKLEKAAEDWRRHTGTS